MWGISRTQSNLIFVDVDEKPDADPPKTGMATFDWLDVLHGWPPTLETTSPSGGRHLFYDASEFGSFMHIGKPDGPHPYVDFAQHVLVPGCGGYALTRDLSIAPAPEWLYQFKAGTKYASAGSGRSGWASAAGRPRQRPLGGRLNNPANVAHMTHWLLNDAPLAISGQCGDETTYQVVAGHLKDWGIGQRMSWRLMRDNWNKRCTPPWTDQGLWAKVCSAWRSLRENRPGELSAEAQFPDDAHEYTAGPEAPAARARRLKVASFARAAKKGHVTRTPVLGCQGGRPYVATGRTKVVDGVRVPVVREIVEE
jgi:hypothetical protein